MVTDGMGDRTAVVDYLVRAWRAECEGHGDDEASWPQAESVDLARALTGSFPDDDAQVEALERSATAFLASTSRQLSSWRLDVLDRVLRAGGSDYGLAAIAHLYAPSASMAPPVASDAQAAAAGVLDARSEALAGDGPDLLNDGHAGESDPARAEPETDHASVGTEAAPAADVLDAAEPATATTSASGEPAASLIAPDLSAGRPEPEPVQPVDSADDSLAAEPMLHQDGPASDHSSPPAGPAEMPAAGADMPAHRAEIPADPTSLLARPETAGASGDGAEGGQIGADRDHLAPEHRLGQEEATAQPAAEEHVRPQMPEPPWPDEFDPVPVGSVAPSAEPGSSEPDAGSENGDDGHRSAGDRAEPDPDAELAAAEAVEDTDDADDAGAPTRTGVGVSVSDRATFESTVCSLVDDKSEFTVAFVGLDEVPGASLGVPEDASITPEEEAACRALLWSVARRATDRGSCYAIGRGLVAVVLDRGRPKDIDRMVRKLPSAEVSAAFSWGAARFPDEANDIRELLRMALVRLANMREEKLTPRILVNRIRRAVTSRN